MEETLIEKIGLPGRATLEIYDSSRTQIGDRMLVILTARVCIPVDSLYDSGSNDCKDLPPPDKIRGLIGDPVVYEHTRQRRFVDKGEKTAVLENLRADFDRNMRPYLMHPAFPCRYVRKQIREQQQRSTWYK